METAAMHLRVYRDEAHSGHLELIGGGDRPWAIDLVSVISEVMLITGFAAAIAAHLLR